MKNKVKKKRNQDLFPYGVAKIIVLGEEINQGCQDTGNLNEGKVKTNIRTFCLHWCYISDTMLSINLYINRKRIT